MSALVFALLILATVPFLLVCLWGFYRAPKKRVVPVTVLAPASLVEHTPAQVAALPASPFIPRKPVSAAAPPRLVPIRVIERDKALAAHL
jgi:hypothetical protein